MTADTKWFSNAGAASDLIPIKRFVDEHVFATESGGYGATLGLAGVDPECLSEQELSNVTARLIQAHRLIPEDCTLYQIVLKRRGCELPQSRYAMRDDEPAIDGRAVAETQQRRHAFLSGQRLGAVELYWTIYANPPKSKKQARPEAVSSSSDLLLRRLRSTVVSLRANLDDLAQVRQLDCHAIAALYSHLATLEPHLTTPRLISRDNVDRQLVGATIHWKADGLEIGRRHARAFSLLRRPNGTRPNLFGKLLRLDADMILVLESQRCASEETRAAVSSHQTFKDLFRHSLLTIAAHAKGGKEIAKSANTVAADKGVDNLGDVVDDIENRGVGYSQFSLIGLLHSRSKEELSDQMAQVHRIVGESEAAVIEEGLGSFSAYCAMFPGAGKYGQSFNVRRCWLREDHLANLSLIYAPYLGEPVSESLEDEALCAFETRDGSPFFFDPYHNGLRGMLVIGAPRRGKSFLINFMLDMEPKYGGFVFIFDIGGSYESTVLKHGGSVVRFGLDGPRLNPFSLPPTGTNLAFVSRLIRLLLVKGGATIRPVQERDLADRIAAMYSLPPEIRRLKHLILPPELQPYLAKWTEGGMYCRIFDNVVDELQLSRVVAFDFQSVGGEEHADLMEPLIFWVKWQTASITHDTANLGVPKVEIFDECWKHMQDPEMLSMILNSSKTAGKHLGGIILATHAADDLGAHTRLIRNACTDTLFLGGPFDREQYRELFSLHDRQLDLITSLQRGESLLVRLGYSKVLVTNVDQESAWHYTTRPKDRQRREEAIKTFGRENAFRELVATATAK